MTRGVRPLLIALVIAVWAVPEIAAQTIPPAVQQELNRRSMSEAEARAMAQQLGINLDDPVQAAQRARELGVPESTIRAMLRSIRDGEEGQAAAAAGAAVTGATPVDPTVPANTVVDTTEVVQTTLEALESARLRGDAEAQNLAGAGEEVGEEVSDQEEPGDEEALDEEALEFFGYAVFDGIPEAFQPNPVGPVDDAYVVGPGDELRVTVWGAAEFAYDLTVDAEGRIYVPNVGQFLAAGKRLSTLRTDFRRFLSQSYAGLVSDPPTASLDLTIARLRPVQIYVLGEVSRPGGYTVSPNATGFNVLYATGGPLTRGSLRNIRIVRDGRPIGQLDIYNYLLNGYERNPIRLQTNDFVFVPPRGTTVAISGAVRRPAVFELKGDEDFAKLLEFAGGLLPEAYTKTFQIERIVPFAERMDASIAREVLDLSLADVLEGRQEVSLRDGDVVRIRSISDRLDNAVSVLGAVFQPGSYELPDGAFTVKDLLAAADGLTEVAYRPEATLVRLDEDFTEEIVTLDLNRVLSDDPRHNLPLRARDQLQIQFRTAVQLDGEIEVTGQVRAPGVQPYRTGLTLRDALVAAGGLQDTLFTKTVFLDRADIYRRDGRSINPIIIPFNLEDALAGVGQAGLALAPDDEIRVYAREVEQVEGVQVEVTGAVRAPGSITYREGLTVEDAILQSGGLTQFAYLNSVRVSRPDPTDQSLAATFEVPLTGLTRDLHGRVDPAAVRAALRERSFPLYPGDQVTVVLDPDYRPLETVLVTGEVAFPGSYAVESDNETIASVIRRAGGVSPTGYLGGARLFRDGQPVAVDFELALANRRDDMRLLPGDQLSIPRVPNTVQVTGNVAREALIRFLPGQRVSYYLDRAGGRSEETEAVYLTQADGTIRKLRGGLFPSDPRVTDGAIINVTRKEPKPADERTDVGQIITETISVISAALTAIVLATRL